jgi:hypothetical protein
MTLWQPVSLLATFLFTLTQPASANRDDDDNAYHVASAACSPAAGHN